MRVLAIDGGGIRGLIPAMVLAEIEERTGRPCAELFDLIAGTSTGGILACALAAPAADGKGPRHTAAALVELYAKDGPGIFHRSLAQRAASLDGLVDEKHDATALERTLATYLGETRLSETVTRLLVTSYDLETRTPFFFKSWRTDEAGRDAPLRIVARATSAAPTYFEPLLFTPEDGSPPRALVDGGVFANNPAMCAYAECRRIAPEAAVRLVSLGTGQLTRPIHYAAAKDWGLIEWMRPVIDVVFDGVADTVDYQLNEVLPDGAYHRLQATLTVASDALDDATPHNIADLAAQGSALIRDASAEIDRIAAALLNAPG